MGRHIFLASPAMLLVALAAHAGTIDDGHWSPSGCGPLPEAPAVESGTVDSVNQGITAVNEWQKKLQVYDECMINEANADAGIISESANSYQAKYREASKRVNEEITAARKKFSSQSAPPGVMPGMMPGSGMGSGMGY